MNAPYLDWIRKLEQWWAEGATLPHGPFPPSPPSPPKPDAPRALFFAPHPDDESITGALAVRLLHEAGLRIVNIAVTLGSRKEQRPRRLAELRHACAFLGFELELPAAEGFENVTPEARRTDPAHWHALTRRIAGLIQQHRPVVVFCPHAHDAHPTHIGTHDLVMDALRLAPPNWDCRVIETEFWAPMEDPNLLVEIPPELLARMMAATACHAGEVQRNPYHLRLPAWAMDNVRRGAERVGGFGSTAPGFLFGQLFRVRRAHRNEWLPAPPPQKLLPASLSAATLLA
ncbi:PIG-L deacetylase family protein [Limisphaera sp. 4302-co]|uniref:PIG-L deacetylase family protein n=1 Tax=Limisphaera sp. 4302-co TaxID=3400417 RepID=UPI003C1D7239